MMLECPNCGDKKKGDEYEAGFRKCESCGEEIYDIHYPSPLEALRDKDLVPSIWCGIKYSVWQALHLGIAMMVSIIVILVTPIVLGYIALSKIYKKLAGALVRRLPERKNKRNKKKIKTGKIQEIPGGKYVYNNQCPVSMSMKPKWFKKIFGDI